MLIWSIWKHRNDVLWNGSRLAPHRIVLRTKGWMHEFHKWHKPMAKKATKEVQKWRKLKRGGSNVILTGHGFQMAPRRREGGYGVILRDHLREFLAGTADPIERPTPAL